MFNIFTDCESPLRMQQNAKSKVKRWSIFKYFEKVNLSEFKKFTTTYCIHN